MRISWAQMAAGALTLAVVAGLLLLPGRLLGPSSIGLPVVLPHMTAPAAVVAEPVPVVVPAKQRHAAPRRPAVVRTAPIAQFASAVVVTQPAVRHAVVASARKRAPKPVAKPQPTRKPQPQPQPQPKPTSVVAPPKRVAAAPTPAPAPAPAAAPTPAPAPTPATRVLADTAVPTTPTPADDGDPGEHDHGNGHDNGNGNNHRDHSDHGDHESGHGGHGHDK